MKNRDLIIELMKLDPEIEITVQDNTEPSFVYDIFGVDTILLDGKQAASISPIFDSPLETDYDEDEEDEE